MPSKLQTIAVAWLLLVSACDKSVPAKPDHRQVTQAPAVTDPVASVSPWTFSQSVDQMTDKTTLLLTTTSLSKDASFSVSCSPLGTIFIFASNQYLGHDVYHDLMYRLDSDKMSTARVLLSNRSAVFVSPKKMRSATEIGGERFMVELNGWEFATELVVKPHHKLLVRLNSADGKTIDAEFNIEGVKAKVKEFDARCAAITAKAR